MSIQLSVITPVLNGIRYIESCILNVIAQNCAEVEHVIIDGDSTDGTVEVIQHYAERYEHIRWVSEKDRGQSHAMNKGVQMSQGNILGFLNVDDYYEPEALRDAVMILKDLPEPSLLVGNCNVWDDNSNLLFLSKPSKIGLKYLLLGKYLEAFPMNPSAYFYHRSLHQQIGLYKTDEHFGMDVHFIFKAVQQANITYLNRTWGNYRYLDGTKTFKDDKNGGNAIRVRRITQYYRKQQPAYYRAYLIIFGVCNNIVNLFNRFTTVRNNP